MNINKKRILFGSCTLLVTVAIIVLIIILCRKEPEPGETYVFVNAAIAKTEALDNFMLQLNSAAQVTLDGQSQRTDTTGYIYSDKEMDLLYAYINSKSASSINPEADFDVTVALHSDGKQVYDNATGKDVPVDMTCEEFETIVEEYGLYHYDEKHVKSVSFNENQKDGYENSGNITVKLTTPGDKVLTNYAKVIEEIAEEPVNKEDLKVMEANVIYAIYEEMVTGQSYRFCVEYTSTKGEKITYQTSSEVTYDVRATQESYENQISEKQ